MAYGQPLNSVNKSSQCNVICVIEVTEVTGRDHHQYGLRWELKSPQIWAFGKWKKGVVLGEKVERMAMSRTKERPGKIKS